MGTSAREAIERNVTRVVDPAAFLRDGSSTGGSAEFWTRELFQAALAAGALEKLDGLSELIRRWRPHLEGNPDWNPGRELRDIILSSDTFTERDKRKFAGFWTQATRMKPHELARAVAPALDRIEPVDEGERAWNELMKRVVKDVRRVFGPRSGMILANPVDTPLLPRLLSAILAYLQATRALDLLHDERVRFLEKRYRELQRISGLISGPADLADAHTEYANAPR